MRTARVMIVLCGMGWVAACGGSDDPQEQERSVSVPPPAGTFATPAGRGAGTGGAVGNAGTGAGLAGRTGAAGAMVPPPPPPAGSMAPPIAGRMGVAGAGGAAVPPPPTAGAAGGSTAPMAMGDRATAEGTCARWKADRANISEGTWSGNIEMCTVGDISADGRANALRVLNLYRWLADMPPVETDPTMDQQAQACALLQHANGTLSHTPPTTWKCYMEEGAKASGRCNISSGPGVSSVDGYMIDPGNPTTIGHRRWILSNSFGPTGLGSTSRFSCMMTFGKMKVGKPWMAWPSPGFIPIQVMKNRFGQGIDQTGWTVQSDTINLSAAQVAVTANGENKAVTVTQLQGGYGSRYAFRFNPMGWETTAGTKYDIAVTGIPTPINYSVSMVDCK